MPCRDTVAAGLAIGLFFSMMPAIPQSIFAAIVAMRVRANVPIAMAACFVSNPFTNVPFWVAQIRLGQWLIDVLSLPIPHFLEKAHMSLPGVGTMSVGNFIVGFVAMGVLMGLSAYPLVHLFSALMPHHLPVRSLHMRQAIKRRGESRAIRQAASRPAANHAGDHRGEDRHA